MYNVILMNDIKMVSFPYYLTNAQIFGHKIQYWAIVGAVPKIRRTIEGMRTHPYARVTLS